MKSWCLYSNFTGQATPVPQLQPLSMLPRLTPKSGVSFRSRSSCFGLNPPGTEDEIDNEEMSHEEPLNSDNNSKDNGKLFQKFVTKTVLVVLKHYF